MAMTLAFDHVDESAAQLFAALSDPTRIHMIRLMVEHGPAAPRSLFEDELPVAKASVGYHLSILRNAQLLRVHHAGSNDAHSLQIEVLERAVPALLHHLRGEEPLDTVGSE